VYLFTIMAYIPIVVAVLRITTGGDGNARGFARVDCVDASERVDIYLEVGESTIRAGLW
jgi:hypothetical protein